MQTDAGKGRRGQGRMALAKTFVEIKIESVYKDEDGKYFERKFNFDSDDSTPIP